MLDGWLEDSQVEDFGGVTFMEVDEGVVVSAEETEVGYHGFASVGPGDNVMYITPPRGAGAPVPDTVTVPGDNGPA